MTTSYFLHARAHLPSLPDWAQIPDFKPWLTLDHQDLINRTTDNGFFTPLNKTVSPYGDSKNEIYQNRTLQVGQEVSKSAYFFSKILEPRERLLDWARDNISKKVKDVRFTFSTPGRDRVGPHADFSRSYTMVYLLETGGNNHSTSFYRMKDGSPITRELGDHVNDYELLEKISTTVIPLHTWTFLNARILHSIDHIMESRVSIQVSFAEFPDDLPLVDPVYYTVDQ